MSQQHYKAAEKKIPARKGKYQLMTTQRTQRKPLKGLAAYVIDVTPGSGDRAFTLSESLWKEYKDTCGRAQVQDVLDEKLLNYYRNLQKNFEFSWLRALNNSNIAFTCTYPKSMLVLSGRYLAAKYIQQVLEEIGYPTELDKEHLN